MFRDIELMRGKFLGGFRRAEALGLDKLDNHLSSWKSAQADLVFSPKGLPCTERAASAPLSPQLPRALRERVSFQV